MVESIGVANCNRELPDAQRVRITELDGGQGWTAGADADDSQIRVRVESDDIALEGTAVGRSDARVVVAVHDVRVGKDEPVGCEDGARSFAAGAGDLDDRGSDAFD